MNIVRGFTLAVVAVLGTGLLQAQSGVGPITPNFNIGIDGWDPFQSFTASTNTDNNDNEFIPGETGTCVNGGLPPTCDPLIHFNVGGDPIGVGSTFGFSADDDGGGSFDFVNDGPPTTFFRNLTATPARLTNNVLKGNSVTPLTGDGTAQ